jgi:hypothetical protein
MRWTETMAEAIVKLRAIYLSGDFDLIEKKDLVERLPRNLSGSQMRELVAMVNRAIDPDAPYAEK